MDPTEPMPRHPVEGRLRDTVDFAHEPPSQRPRRLRLPLDDAAEPGRGRSVAGRRAVVFGVGATLTALAGTLLVGSFRRALLAYVHSRPGYALGLSGTKLEPEPPAWFRGGSAQFIARVWGRSPGTPSTSVLDLDHEHVASLFRREPWVRRVRRVATRHPNLLDVALDYREPVALAKLSDGRSILIDRDGVMLPAEDVDLGRVDLVALVGFAEPRAPRYGEIWRGADDLPPRGLPDAARLADFLKMKRAELATAVPIPHFVVIHSFSERELYVQITAGRFKPEGESLMIKWEAATATAAATGLTDERRWSLLCDWLRSHPLQRTERWLYLNLTPSGVEVEPRDGDSRPAPIARRSSRIKT